ncbi:hypothetical protein ACJX0J_007644, partial [Zea mays]
DGPSKRWTAFLLYITTFTTSIAMNSYLTTLPILTICNYKKAATIAFNGFSNIYYISHKFVAVLEAKVAVIGEAIALIAQNRIAPVMSSFFDIHEKRILLSLDRWMQQYMVYHATGKVMGAKQL